MHSPATARVCVLLANLALAQAGSSCAEPDPDLSLKDVVPSSVTEGNEQRILIRGRFGAWAHTSFESPAASSLDSSYRASLGQLRLPEVRRTQEGLEALVPENLPAGTYDVTVQAPWGRTATLSQAFRILAVPPTETVIAGLRFEPIGPQKAATPFVVTLLALDSAQAPLTGFSGTVALEDLSSALLPRQVSLVAGRWTGQVEVRSPLAVDRLRAWSGTVEAFSNDFLVGPGDSSLRFVTPPLEVAAGNCSDAVRLALLDADGQPAMADGPVTVALGTVPELAELFADPLCSVAISSVPLDASGSAAIYVRSTIAHQLELSAATDQHGSDSQTLRIVPAPPTRTTFVSAPRVATAGECSQELVVQVEDVFGNPIAEPAVAAIALALEGAPAETGLFSDTTCEQPTSQADLAPFGQRARFQFSGTRAGAFAIRAAAPGTDPAVQQAVVVPAAPDRLVISSPVQAVVAGDCSAPISVALEDPFGNPASLPIPLAVTLAASPPAGFTLFRSVGCAVPGSEVTLPAGQSSFDLSLRGTVAGAATLDATAAGVLPAWQPVTIRPGPATDLVFAPISSPQRRDHPFAASLTARDAWDNLATDFALPVSFATVPPGGEARCATRCLDAYTTEPFSSGAWSGTLTASPNGTWQLEATAGALTGQSNSFEVVGNVLAPLVRLDAIPPVVHNGSVTFDASASTDLNCPTSALEVSFDFTGSAGGPPPWTPWSLTKTASHSFSKGTYEARVAVRNPEGVVGYAQRRVRDVASSELCLVDTASDVDDGGKCPGNSGADGKLSLREAINSANGKPGTAIGFSGPMTLDPSSPFVITADVEILAPDGVVLHGAQFEVAAGTAVLSGLELTGAAALVVVREGAQLELVDSHLHDGPLVSVEGAATLRRVRMERCGATCVEVSKDTARAELLFSRFFDSPLGIRLAACAGPAPLLVQSSTFAGLQQAIVAEVECTGPIQVRHATFDDNGTGIQYRGGSGHVLRNSIFTRHTVRAAECGSASFLEREGHLLFANADDGCLANDPATLAADPLFLDPAARDYRPLSASPARDSATALPSVDVNGPAPGLFDGPAPDRGAEEAW